MLDIAVSKDPVEAVGGVTVMIRASKYESGRRIYLPDELVTILSQHVGQHSPDGDPISVALRGRREAVK